MPGKLDYKEIEGSVEAAPAEQSSGITMDALAAAVASLAQSVAQMSQRVESLAHRPTQPAAPIPIAPTADQLLAGLKGMVAGEQKSGTVFKDRFGRPYKFANNTMVQILDEEKIRNLRTANRLAADQPLYGVVESLMYWRKNANCPKYMVNMGKGFGSDGFLETDLEIAYA